LFDDPNLVSRAGLVPVMSLAERAGLHALVRRHVTIDRGAGERGGVEAGRLVAGMAAGADSIDDMDLLRHRAMPQVFARAPSTLGVVPAVVHLVRAENPIRGCEQQSCGADGTAAMITDRVPAVRLPLDHAGDHRAAAIPAQETWKTAEILILRHQLAVLQRHQARRPNLN
jgi:hypothetical protein